MTGLTPRTDARGWLPIGRCLCVAIACLLLIGGAHAHSAVAAEPPVQLQTLEGQKISGTLATLAATSVEVNTTAGRERFAAANLQFVKPAEPESPPTAKASVIVELVDGSHLIATSFRVERSKAKVELTGGGEVSIPTAALRWVRFVSGEPNDPLASQWLAAVGNLGSADLLVLRKEGALDFLEGVLGDAGDETVQFQLDGEAAVPVKRIKIEGLVYYHAKGDELPEAAAVAFDAGGSQWEIRSLELDGQQVKLTTPAGVQATRPFAALARIDYSSANTQYLGDLEPESFKYSPFYSPRTELPILGESYKPRRNVGFDGLPLKLDGRAYAKGIALHSRSELSYRLRGKFRRLKGLVGIDDSVRDAGDIKLLIRGDGKVLWEGEVRGTEPARPLDIDLGGCKRLEFLVDFGADLDIGDVVDLCDLRVTK